MPEHLGPKAREIEEDFLYPPPTVVRWLDHQAINSAALVAELWYWAVKMAGGDPSPMVRLEAENERLRHALTHGWSLGQYNWNEEFNQRPPLGAK